MFCKNCHFEFEANELTCPACGSQDVVSITEKNEEDEAIKVPVVDKTPNRIAYVISSCICMALGLVLAYYGQQRYDQIDRSNTVAYIENGMQKEMLFAALIRFGYLLLFYGIVTLIAGAIRAAWNKALEKEKSKNKNHKKEQE